jgi:hypothetical protein
MGTKVPVTHAPTGLRALSVSNQPQQSSKSAPCKSGAVPSSSIVEDYVDAKSVLISNPTAVDSPPLGDDAKLKSLRNSLGLTDGKGKLRNLKIDLWSHTENNSGSNSANNTVVAVDPVASVEFSSLSALYDEMIVHGVTVYNSLESSGGTAYEVHGCISYDPVDATAYSLYTTSLAASQKTGPIRASGFSATSLSSPFSMTKNGHWTWEVKCPKGASKTTAGGSVTDNLCTGQWISTQAVSQAYFGFIKPYIEAGGPSVITALATTLCMHCEFRSRT